ncbi:MAG: redoxin family protein [Gemmatimonadota bacterium]|nr:redoxin family protein [Gemmatimonadota bacterium]
MAKRATLVLFALAVVALMIYTLVDRTRMIEASEIGAFGFEAGELVADFDYRAIDGRRGSLESVLDESEALVVVMRTSECPVSRRYGHRLAELEREYGQRGVQFVYLNVSPQDTREKAVEDIETFGFEAPYILDPRAEAASRLQPRVSSEVFVIDRARTLRYRGAVDDQFGITFQNPEVDERYLKDALDSVLAGKDVEVASTEASGCYLEGAQTLVPERPVTYYTRVQRILDQNCVTCHREGGVAPMALDSYEQAYGFRHMIEYMVTQDLMPPWYASPEHGEWANDRSLSERNERDLLAWIEAGAPEGDPELAALPRHLEPGWQLGYEPDVVVRLPEPEEIPESGVLDYRHVYVKTDWPEDRWLTAAEIVPTAPEVVHHVIVYLESPEDEERGGWVAGYAPGVPPSEWPEGTGKRIPAGSWLMFELHYTPNGKPHVDDSHLGLVFADGRPEREVMMAAVAETEFEIPPHAPNHEVVAEMEFQSPGEILSFLPHMHLRGKAFRFEMDWVDGTTDTLLHVPRYEFNWQLEYEPAEPLRVRPGDRLRGIAWYDNSEANPSNPDPSVPVRYGEQSFEEMMFGFFEFVPDGRRGGGERRAGGQ